MTTILYARVSTIEQTIDHQLQQAKTAGFVIDEVVADHGLSGVGTKLRERPEGKRLYDLLRRGDVLVVRWVDRLGRNYEDVCEAIRYFMSKGVVIRTVINGLAFDGSTKDPMQQAVRDAMIAFMAATAQAQVEATREAQRAGIDHARQLRPQTYRGRKPSFSREQYTQVCNLVSQGAGTSEIARSTKLTRQTVLRIRADKAAAERSLSLWEL